MKVEFILLGGFSVSVEGREVPASTWGRRQAASLVKMLALAPGRRLHREQVMDALWPGLAPDAAAPRLHKAAHYARRALGQESGGIAARNDMIELFPGDEVRVDAVEFRRAAEVALAQGREAQVTTALDLYTGQLLPDDLYESWAEEQRESLRQLHLDLLRLSGRWEEVVHEDPLDEQAHVALAQSLADRGDARGALRQLERLDQALRRELGTAPGARAEQLRAQLLQTMGTPVPSGGAGRTERRLIGRRGIGDELRARLADAEKGRGSTLLVTGPPGVGKSAVLELATSLAARAGWRTARGMASAIEGPWPYASVLEALGDLCRKHPGLLDGLDDRYREEFDKALSGRDVMWSGESGHQRLFVAAAELVRLAAAGRGLLLVIDDLHEADQASLRLLHYLARCAVTEHVVLVLASRPASTDTPPLDDVQASLVSRGIGSRVEVRPLDREATLRLLADRFPDLDEASRERVWALSGGLPFTALELGRATAGGGEETWSMSGLPPDVQRTLQRVALLGLAFTTDEFLAVSGLPEAVAYRHLETAQQTLVVERSETGYSFRHPLLRDAILDGMSGERLRAYRLEVARQLAGLGAPPARVAHQFLAAGAPREAIAHVLPAVETAGALGAYRDALDLVDAVVDHASGETLGHLLARRGDLLMALGNPEAAHDYRRALAHTRGTEHRLVRARLARAASFGGDFDTARAALAGLELEGDEADGPILLARGNFSYFSGDIDAAWDAATRAREMLLGSDDPWQYVDLVALQGLIAHQRGEWFERFRVELRRTQGNTGLVSALFDAHLCVAEYVLYGPTPYSEVISLAEELQRRAEHFGALRGVAFARALIGEAALLMGDLDRAQRELEEAADLHRDADASAGVAHSLQRLAEVHLARGDPVEAQRLLQQALPLARWSIMSMHLLQRIHGLMVRAAPDPGVARALVARAEATMGDIDRCPFCDITFAVPAAIACADAGDFEAAQRHLATARACAARWEGVAWDAAVLEASAHLERAQGDSATASRLLQQAATLFAVADQPLDARRCSVDREHLSSALA